MWLSRKKAPRKHGVKPGCTLREACPVRLSPVTRGSESGLVQRSPRWRSRYNASHHGGMYCHVPRSVLCLSCVSLLGDLEGMRRTDQKDSDFGHQQKKEKKKVFNGVR